VTVEAIDSVDAARRAVDDGDVDAAVVVPDGFSAAGTSTTGEVPTMAVLTSVDSALAGQVTRSIAESFVAQVNADRLSIATARAAGVPEAELAGLASAAAQLRLPLSVDEQPIGAKRLDAISYYAPGMAIFFVLFSIGFASRSFFGERREGTLDRMAVAPVTPQVILAGKALSILVYGLASLLTIALVTSLAFGADWGTPAAVAVVCVALVLSVVALAAFVITTARTERQAENLSSIVVFSLALLGGNFIFVSGAPEIMRRLALATPNGWALRAFTDMATTRGGALHDLRLVAVPVVAILAFTAVVAVVSARRAGGLVRP